MLNKWFAAAIFFLLPTFCLAESEGAPLADRVPGDALIYVGWAGSQSLGPAYPSSHLKAILDASSLPELFDSLVPQLIAKIPANPPRDRENVRLLAAIGAPMWRHPSAFYFGGVDWNTGGPPMPRIALICDAGSEADALQQSVTSIIREGGRGGPPLIVRKYGTVVVLSLGPVAAIDKQFSAPPADGLLNSSTFKTALGQVQQNGIFAAYLDVQGLVKMVDDGVQRIGDLKAVALWPKIRDGLGLTGINQMISSAGFDGQDWMVQCFVSTGANKTGLASMFSGQPLSDDCLAVVPQSANRFAAGHFDLAALFRAIHSGIEQFDPTVAQHFNQGLTIANAMLGLDIEKDFLDSFGDQWVLYTDRSIGGPGLLGMVIVNKLTNPEKAEAALTGLSQRANMIVAQAMGNPNVTIEFRQSVCDGLTVHYLAVPIIAPGWAVKDGNLYLALYPQVLSAAANHVTAKGASILQNPDYVALQKRLGDHKPSSASFLNLPQTAGDGYEDLLMLNRLYLGIADIAGIHTPAMTLPPLNKIIPHLAPSGSVGWSDETGWHHKFVEPFPGSESLAGTGSGTTMIAPVALMSSILLPSLNRARETANRVKCASNERQIGQAMLMYANENKQKYAPDLGTLVKTQDITAAVFICPDSHTELPAGLNRDQQIDWVNVHSDYIYLGSGFGTSAPAGQIMLYEKPGSHDGDGMNLLYGDGHVEWQRTADAMREIDAQQKKFHAGEGGGL